MGTDGLKKAILLGDNSCEALKSDELYWFIERRAHTETRENVYLLTIVSTTLRQNVGFDVASDKSSTGMQEMENAAPEAQKYCTDGYGGYVDIVYSGNHARSIHDKNDTYTAESINADLRHYISLVMRRSRCFAHKPDYW